MVNLVQLADPTMPGPGTARRLSPRSDTVRGKTVGLRVNKWRRFGVFMDRFQELLQERYQPKGFIRQNEEGLTAHGVGRGSPRAEEFFQKADWAVLGLAA